jgi:hypothetical protein
MSDAAIPLAGPDASAETRRCANCGAALDGPYCAACGQKATDLNPTLRHFLHDLTHELLHVDGKIVQSARLLLTRPGFLTREWWAGRRARYVSPIRLYLICSVAFFAAGALDPGGVTVRVRREASAPQDAPGVVRRLSELPEGEIDERVRHALGAWTPRAMFVLVPVFAALVAASTRRSGRNYPQHLYFALHVHAAVFAVAALDSLVSLPLDGVVEGVVDTAFLVFVVWYLSAAFRATYGGTRRRAIIRAAATGVAYFLVIFVTVVAIALASVVPLVF